MGRTYQKMKEIERQIAQIESQNKPTHLLAFLDASLKFIRGFATSETRTRLGNVQTDSWEVTEKEFNSLRNVVATDKIHVLYDDVVSDILETVE